MSEETSQRLDSWKDIAAYLKRDVSTVQRWEKREGMPVHRHQHDKLGSVYAFPSELDAWARSRRSAPEVAPSPPDAPPARRFRWIRPAVVAAALLAIVVATLLLLKPKTGNPLDGAQFVRLTDFEGTEQAAAISRDGRFVAFLSDREGPVDVWVTQIGSGQFQNLTRGKLHELLNPDIRLLGFSPDGALVAIWVRQKSASGSPSINVWAVPTLGGEPRMLVEGAAEVDWSRDGKRLVYHTPAPGDPMFVRAADGGPSQPLFTAAAGIHNHYPLWSHDGRFIYFVQGPVPRENDVYRVEANGGAPQRMTTHGTRVSHLAFLDDRTLVYLATDGEGDGPWLYALDVVRRRSRRISSGVERYSSVAASADGKRLALTVANQRRTLWRVPLGTDMARAADASRITVPIVGGRAPRLGPGYVLYVSSRSDADSIWKLGGGTAVQLWSVPAARVIDRPSISSDGRLIAFAAEERGKARLYVMNADGSRVRAFPDSLVPRGTPAWSPDGRSIAVVAGESHLVRVSLADQKVTTLVPDFAADPVWSPSGDAILFSGREVGTTFPIRAVSAEGQMRPRPNLTLSRGVRHVAFLPDGKSVVVLRGDIVHKNFWAIDLDSGRERQLTDFGADFVIGDFDVSHDGREIIFDREQDDSDIVLVDR